MAAVEHNYLNYYDPFVVGSPTFDITPSNQYTNNRAVVAFGQDREVYYAWVHRNFNNILLLYPNPVTDQAYLSKKLADDGLTFLNDINIGGQHVYDRVNYEQNTLINVMGSVALSTGNDHIECLFSSFIQSDDNSTPIPGGYMYCVGNKTTDWTTAQFRPQPPADTLAGVPDMQLHLSPNQFSNTVHLSISNSTATALFNMDVYNLLGQRIISTRGNAAELNERLNRQIPSMIPGTNWMCINGENLRSSYKLIKH
ncbi:MAG TPA: hypothetical protein PKX92_04450 [Edaphocola sp.]|nr:hypothetical protein [Edaphocola sp.]